MSLPALSRHHECYSGHYRKWVWHLWSRRKTGDFFFSWISYVMSHLVHSPYISNSYSYASSKLLNTPTNYAFSCKFWVSSMKNLALSWPQISILNIRATANDCVKTQFSWLNSHSLRLKKQFSQCHAMLIPHLWSLWQHSPLKLCPAVLTVDGEKGIETVKWWGVLFFFPNYRKM